MNGELLADEHTSPLRKFAQYFSVKVKYWLQRVGVVEKCLGEVTPRGVKELLSLEMLRTAELYEVLL